MKENKNIEKVTLKDICIDGKGSYGIGASAVDYDFNLPTYLRITDINDDGTVNHEGLKSVNDPDSDKYFLEKNDIVFARTGNSTGKSYFYDERDGRFVYAGFLIKFSLDEKKVNPKYIKLYTLSDRYKNWVNSFSTGSTRANINAKGYSDMPLKLPDREVQNKIVKIIEPLNDKIRINNEMNKTLEEMAQTLFKRWFIDFDFPNENGEPYRSSGEKMVDSELGEIPEGWEIDSIYELADYINGTSFKSNEYGDHGLPVIKIVELKNGITDSTKFCISDKDKKFHLKNGEILFSWSGNPQTSIDIFIWSLGKAILNQHTFKVIPYNEKIDSYIYFLLKYLKPKFCDIASNKQTTGLGHVTVKDLKNLKIAFNYEQIYKFCEISENILKKLLNNQQEIQSLIETRDTLLPKLMSGEIEV